MKRSSSRAWASCVACGLFAIGLAAGCVEIETATPPTVIVAQFDPTASPPVLPLPNDVVRDPRTGLLTMIPDLPGASPAQVEFNQYLRSLDGFPPETPVTASFSGAIDQSTLTTSTSQKNGSVAVFDVTTMQPLSTADYSLTLSADMKTMTIVPHFTVGKQANQPWSLGHTYLVVVFGSGDPAGADPAGVRGATGTPVVASPTTFFLRSARPLITPCPDNDPKITTPACLCPTTNGMFDSSCRVATGLTLAQATQLEPARQQLSAQFAKYLPQAGMNKSRDNVVLVWQFTIAHGPFAVFDPTSQRIPFPNDILLDPMTGKVNLPVDPMSPAAAITKGLNTLDGFSTTANATAPIIESDDNVGTGTSLLPPKNTVVNQTVRLINVTTPSSQPIFSVQPEKVNGGADWDGLLQITPVRPLRPDKSEYVAVLTSGITDTKGRGLRPSTLMALVKLGSPLVDAMGHSTLPGTLTDAQAMQLEPLRKAYAGIGTGTPSLWDLLAALSIPKDQVAMVWTFRTQSMTQTLLGLAAAPQMAMLPTDVTILDVEPSGGTLGPDAGSIVFGRMKTHLALSNKGAPGAVLDPTGVDATIPFLMVTPASGMAKGVVLVQHGITRWRGDILAIAEAFNKAGWAIIGIDINFHGARTACTSNADCNAGTCNPDGTCTTSLLVKCTSDSQCMGGAKGSCNTQTGACAGGFSPSSSLCLTHLESMKPVTECLPAASGNAFLYLANPFSIRDNLRQHVLDLSQLQRVVLASGPNSLHDQLAALKNPILVDNTLTAFLGQSLGGIEGTLFLAASPRPAVGVLNVPGGRLVDLFVTSPTLAPQFAPLLGALKIAPDTTAYYQLLDTFRWILDPGDPINFGRYVESEPIDPNHPFPARSVIVQEAGKDTVIPNAVTDALAVEIGLPFTADKHPGINAVLATNPMAGPQLVSTFFPSATHGFIFDPNQPSIVPGQVQAVVWVDSGGKAITAPGP